MPPSFTDIRRAIIGEGRAIPGPFGPRPLRYADYVASGRSLSWIEDAIRDHVLPGYGNTHTETSHTGRQTTRLREMARDAVRRSVGADPGHAVIFVGSGATGAADKLSRALMMGGLDARAVVFVGPYEHHSNDLPWRESGAQIERIPLNGLGQICLDALRARLEAHADAPFRLGAFSAASNVTGVLSDMRAIARLLHAHDAWCLADYAAAAPYVTMHLAESAPGAGDRIDAAILSPHKFPGGPGASGVLVCDRRLMDLRRPTVAGGGTVSYVTARDHCYVTDIERREEAGTPGIIENIRAGMVLALKSALGDARVEAAESRATARMQAALRAIDGLELLGPRDAPRIGIFSFNIRVGDRLLHHNYVVALLNDLFGIQARGGCSCAGPYGHALLNIDEGRTRRHEAAVALGHSAFRPGWARLGVNWFFDDDDIDTIAAALEFIARNGLALLPLYRLDVASGVWRARCMAGDRPPESLIALIDRAAAAQTTAAAQTATAADCAAAPDFASCLRAAGDLVARARALPATPPPPLLPEEEALRWFWLPHEASAALVTQGEVAA